MAFVDADGSDRASVSVDAEGLRQKSFRRGSVSVDEVVEAHGVFFNEEREHLTAKLTQCESRISSLQAQNERLRAWKRKQQSLYENVSDKGAERTAQLYKRDREHALHLLKYVYLIRHTDRRAC